jgi:hypothetical protein
LSVSACAFASQQSSSADQRPRRVGNAASGSATITVKAKDNFQKALDAAQPGDTLVLEAGAVYVGEFVLPRKDGDAFITIQSSKLDQLPGAGVRVSPSHAPLMPKLVAPGNGAKALSAQPGAHHYRFVGVEFAPIDERADVRNILWLGENETQTDLSKVPHHLEFDRCYIHGYPDSQQVRAVALNSAATDITNSYISDIHKAGADTQAICGWSGPGPYKIINNYLEAAGENVMFGGSDNFIPGLNPSDIEIRRNYFRKPAEWEASGRWTVKNLIEFKAGKRVMIEGNVFENNWAGGQTGYALSFGPRNQDGRSPWVEVSDVTFQNNVVRNTTNLVSILGSDYNFPSQPVKNLTIRNNLLDGGTRGGGTAFQVTLMKGGPQNLVVEHNTFIHTSHLFYFGGTPPATGFVFRDNISTGFTMGGDGGPGWGQPTIDWAFPGNVWSGNVAVATFPPESAMWFAEHYPKSGLVQSIGAIGFTDVAGKNYKLAASSRFKGKATDKRDVGCDFNQLEAAINGVTSPASTATPPTPQSATR